MSQNARLIEKNIFTGVAANAAGDSATVDLWDQGKPTRFSCQAVYTVDTPVGATITFKASNDGTNWTNLQAATSITAAGSTLFTQSDVSYRYFKVSKAISSGEVTLTLNLLVVGDDI